jgi:Domain of unknown function (DUF4440)
MRIVNALFAAVTLVSTSLLHAQAGDAQASDRAYIRQAESDWAESDVTNDVSVLERVLADDFMGVEIDGSHYSKAHAIQGYRTQPSEFASSHLHDVVIRFYGNTAVAQGSENWTKKSGISGRFVWTDTWIKRGGRWQIVAAEDLVPPSDTTERQ